MRRTTTRSVTRSGRERSALDAAYDECRRLVRTTRPTEYALMQLMPPAVRPACWALYAALASADDLVDSTEGTPQERARRLREWRVALEADLASGTSDDPVRRALTDAVWHWGLDLGDLLGALDAVQGDEGREGVATWQEWRERAHAQNVSWPEQLMRMLVRSGLPVPVRLRDLPGFTRFVDGLFLTDMLRDLPEDLDGGQVWFPAEVLDRFQVTPAELISREWTPRSGSWSRTWPIRPGNGWRPPAGRCGTRCRWAPPSCSTALSSCSARSWTRSSGPDRPSCTARFASPGTPSGGSSARPGRGPPWCGG